MICPFMVIALSMSIRMSLNPTGAREGCQEAHCAWWDSRANQCVLMSIAQTLEDLREEITPRR